jgi:hypothetical protein
VGQAQQAAHNREACCGQSLRAADHEARAETEDITMSRHDTRPCTCGSGLPSRWQFDARGIELCRTCSKCHVEKMRAYRPDVLTDPNYPADEAIEQED